MFSKRYNDVEQMIGDGDRSQYFSVCSTLGKAYLAWLLRDMQLLASCALIR